MSKNKRKYSIQRAFLSKINPGSLDKIIFMDHTCKQVFHSGNIQIKEQKKNNIPSLKIKYNKIFGYYIEVTKTHIDKIPDYFIRKQTQRLNCKTVASL